MNPAPTEPLPAKSGDQPIEAEFTITVTEFHDVIGDKGVPTCYEMDGPRDPTRKIFLKSGSHQKVNTKERTIYHTIRVDARHAVIRLKIVGPGDFFRPVGIALFRADGAKPNAVPCNTGGKPVRGSPFSDLRIEGDTIFLTDRPLHGVHPHGPAGTHITYRYVVFIQHTYTGEVGIIDPEIENEN